MRKIANTLVIQRACLKPTISKRRKSGEIQKDGDLTMKAHLRLIII